MTEKIQWFIDAARERIALQKEVDELRQQSLWSKAMLAYFTLDSGGRLPQTFENRLEKEVSKLQRAIADNELIFVEGKELYITTYKGHRISSRRELLQCLERYK